MNRRSIADYVGRLRTKPEHVRQRIAISTAVGTTAVVAVVWMFVVIATGTFQINPNSSANTVVAQNSNQQIEQANQQAKNGFQSLLGAVGFASATTAPPSLTTVDEATSSNTSGEGTNTSQPTGGDQTVIPF